MLERGIYILDTDCFEVGWPMTDYLTPWIQSQHKLPQLSPGAPETILQILNIVLKRLAYPEWCEIEVEPDDDQRNY